MERWWKLIASMHFDQRCAFYVYVAFVTIYVQCMIKVKPHPCVKQLIYIRFHYLWGNICTLVWSASPQNTQSESMSLSTHSCGFPIEVAIVYFKLLLNRSYLRYKFSQLQYYRFRGGRVGVSITGSEHFGHQHATVHGPLTMWTALQARYGQLYCKSGDNSWDLNIVHIVHFIFALY